MVPDQVCAAEEGRQSGSSGSETGAKIAGEDRGVSQAPSVGQSAESASMPCATFAAALRMPRQMRRAQIK